VSRVGLRQLVGSRGSARAVVDAVTAAIGGGVTVEDGDGRLLSGELTGSPAAAGYAVQNDGTSLGWVRGPEPARAVATLLEHLVTKEVECKALGAEVLHLYREINLIYSFSEKLAALLDVERVADLTLREARHSIIATDGAVMLLEDDGALSTVAGFGDELPALSGFRAGHGIVGAVAASGIGEIVNDVEGDSRRVAQVRLSSLIAVPLRVGERVIGVLALASTLPLSYTAAQLKLLGTLGLQAATAIENARLFERTVQAAAERERLLRLHKETEVARAKLESELTLAARIQADLFPAALPAVPGYQLAAHNRPARQCGGDYYDAITLAGEDRVLLCVADVSGKGLPAALVMSNMQATLRALLGRAASLPALAEESSALLFATTAPEKYVTAALAVLSPATGDLRFVGAGHVDTLILRASGDVETLSSTGTPFGLLPPGLPYGESHRSLAPGDTLVLFSDGVPEAQNLSDEEFGEARLLEVLRQTGGASPSDIVTRVVTAIDAFAAGAPQFDDITLLVVRRV